MPVLQRKAPRILESLHGGVDLTVRRKQHGGNVDRIDLERLLAMPFAMRLGARSQVRAQRNELIALILFAGVRRLRAF